ncbi:hypothetical protein JHU04_002625 [Brenneria sp. 4F2]|nr:hypothetical protein [Brenneria bubanii]
MPNIALTNRIMQIHLSSWRYLALLTLPPLAIALNFLCAPQSVLLLILFFLTHYFCWRLWLDERLFRLLNSVDDLAPFDEGMSRLWSIKQGETRTLAERWLGARRLLRRAIWATVVLWVASLILVLWHA